MIASSCERQGVKFWVSIKKPVWYDFGHFSYPGTEIVLLNVVWLI